MYSDSIPLFQTSFSSSTRISRTSYSVASTRRSYSSYCRDFKLFRDPCSLLRRNRRDVSLLLTAVLVLEISFLYTTRICRCLLSFDAVFAFPAVSLSLPFRFDVRLVFRESLRSLWRGEL